MTKVKPDHDTNHDSHDNDNDPSKAPVTITPTGARACRSDGAGGGVQGGRYRLRHRPHPVHADPAVQTSTSGGIWMLRAEAHCRRGGQPWAVNPTTFKRGYICFGRRQQGAR